MLRGAVPSSVLLSCFLFGGIFLLTSLLRGEVGEKPVIAKPLLLSGVVSAPVHWYQVRKRGQHVGYRVQRLSFLERLQQWVLVQFSYVVLPSQETHQTLKAVTSSQFQPLSYEYAQKVWSGSGKRRRLQQSQLLKAQVQNQVLRVVESKIEREQETRSIRLPPHLFFSAFRSWMLVAQPKELKEGVRFAYVAIEESSGKVRNGTTFVQKRVSSEREETWQVHYKLGKEEFYEEISNTGQLLRAQYGEEVEVLAALTPKSARGIFPLVSEVSTWFGDSP